MYSGLLLRDVLCMALGRPAVHWCGTLGSLYASFKMKSQSTSAVFSLALMWTEISVHTTWHSGGGVGRGEWEGSLLLWDQGGSLDMLHGESKQNTLLLLDLRMSPAR